MHDEHKNSKLEHHDIVQCKKDASIKIDIQKEDISEKESSQTENQGPNYVFDQQNFSLVVPSQHPATSPFTSQPTSFPQHNLGINTYSANSSTSTGYTEVTAPGLVDSQFPVFPQFYSNISLPSDISRQGRTVYIGNIPSEITVNEILSQVKTGPIESVRLLPDKNCAFISFLDPSPAALFYEDAIMKKLSFHGKEAKIGWGKPSSVSSTVMLAVQQSGATRNVYLGNLPENITEEEIREDLRSQMATMNLIIPNYTNYQDLGNSCVDSRTMLSNRTVYLGNIHPETTIEEICNIVRGGILHQIKYFPEKHICFITFVNPISATLFYNMSIIQGLIIHNRKIKVGFGKHSGPLPSSIAIAVTSGATRNIYIGNINENITVVKLKKDFSEWGEIELVNMLKEKNCAFVNFTNIEDALKAIEGIKSKEDYKKFRISFGKDRCGNLPKQINNQNNMSLSQSKIAHTGYNMLHSSLETPYAANIVNITHPEEKIQNETPYYTNFSQNENNINTYKESHSPLLYNSAPYNNTSINGKNDHLTYGIVFNHNTDKAK
ncbi:hypothetical protein PORY_002439 [Pneumocystis oryctolagi]|uniref:Uncharacterized protein n=1 Tax=Pneumocystis oryctolagi TaxID=42067 RepID=A0ACB7CAM4_9ASCO|nr:hypothetical protein PORY_002439 [Pneumocystis oryctolagi]